MADILTSRQRWGRPLTPEEQGRFRGIASLEGVDPGGVSAALEASRGFAPELGSVPLPWGVSSS
jgi:hypothetical protein